MIHEGQAVLRRGPSVGDARAVCVLLHGRGRSPDDVLSLAERIGDPEVAWVAPAAADNSWWPGSFLAPLAEKELADGSTTLSEDYQRQAQREGGIGALAGLLIIVAVFLMVIKPGG